MSKEHINIAIDGPVASGKGAVSKGLSQALGISTLDTGAMYRAITLHILDKEIDIKDEKNILSVLNDLDLKIFIWGNVTKVILFGKDVSANIRENRISIAVPVVSSYPAVRDFVNKKITEIVSQCDFILEGRDIGTQVLPNAKYKFFLTASLEERAKRRLADLKENKESITIDQMIEQVKERDSKDINRKVAPLKQAKDAILIDNTNMTLKQTIDTMLKYIKL